MADQFSGSAFFQAYAPRLRAFLQPRISSRLRRRFDEDDVLASAFRSYFLREPTTSFDSENPWPLLVQIAVHKLARQVRTHTAERRGIDQEFGIAPDATGKTNDPVVEAELAEVLSMVETALDSDERESWQLRLQGYELSEIAERLNVSERTVRRHLDRAKVELQKLLDATLPTPQQPLLRSDWLAYSQFRLQRQIGVGAVGKVYQALDRQSGQTVAVKFLKKQFTQHPAARESILAEIEVGSRLHHPSIVRIDGIGATPNAGLFLVMDYLPGGNLAERLARRLPDLSQLKTWLLRLAEGLDAAHAAGVIHCDLKPANVLFDGNGHPQIGDFGLAQWMTGRIGRLKGGTPAYLAPELVDPMFGNPGPWTDVFGLAAIAFHALTGRPPFRGNSLEEVMAQVVDANPIAWPDECVAKIPTSWQELCGRCLSKQCLLRADSVAELRQLIAKLPVM
jgi:RNA polymerase sigma factor (sigma-70 family)